MCFHVTFAHHMCQIAATLDKGQPGTNNGKNTFWNIALTHLLSVSTYTDNYTEGAVGQADTYRPAHNAQRT